MLISTRRSIFWRLFWKEYRVQRAFWLCIAVLAVLLMALPAVTVATGGDRLYWRFAVARILPALFAAACGAMLFATEHEAGTYDFQRSLPLSSSRLLLGKCAFALCSVVLLYAVCWLVAVILSGVPLRDAFAALPGWMPAGTAGRWVHAPVFASLLFAVQVFLSTVLFSLLLRHPLTAAIAGVAAAAAMATYISWNAAGPPADRTAMQLAAVALVAAVDVWFGLRWLDERRIAPAPRRFLPLRSKVAPATFGTRSTARTVGRLLWEFWRQSRGLRLALAAGLAGFIAHLVAMHDANRVGPALIMAIVLAPAYFALLGSIAFFFDQHGYAYRFLADRGVRPGNVWLSRQLVVWTAAAVLAAVLSAIAAGGVLIANVNHVGWPVLGLDAAGVASLVGNVAAAVVSFALLGVAAGQFCSMLFRNGLLAVFFGLLLSGVLALWYGLMWLYGLNWFWSVLPIPLALLLATRLRAPHWLVERNTVRAWLPVVVTLFVPAAALLIAVPLYRENQIPAIHPGFSPDEYERPLTAEEKTTFDLYRRVWDGAREFNRDDSNAIKLTLEASRRSLSPVDLGQTEYRNLPSEVCSLTDLVVRDAKRLEEQGKLDAAMEQYLAVVRISVQFRQVLSDGDRITDSYSDQMERDVLERLPYWAARPHQTPKRILAAASALDKLTSDLPPDVAAVKSEYLRMQRALSGGYAAIIQSYGEGHEASLLPLTDIWSRLPWERTRALRLLNVLTQQQLLELHNAQATAADGAAVEQPVRLRFSSFSSEYGPYAATELPFALHNDIHVPPIEGLSPNLQAERVRRYTVMVALRRGVRLSLMLEAWKLRHGSLPESLTELFKQDYKPGTRGSSLVYTDPFTGEFFRYVREGIAVPFRWEVHGTSFFAEGKFAAHVPFVWSAGPRVVLTFFDTREGKQALPELYDYHILDDPWGYRPARHRPSSEYDLWEAGLPIPVP